jgi:hypothetical protein
MTDPREQEPGKAGRPKKRTLRQKPAEGENKRLGLQTRKVLGKHYANKYRTGRG